MGIEDFGRPIEDRRKELNKLIARNHADFIKRLRDERPEFTQGLDAPNRTFARKVGRRKFPTIVDEIILNLYVFGPSRRQTDVLSELNKDTEDKIQPQIWTRSFTKGARKAADRRLQDAALNVLEFADCMNLSEVKKVMQGLEIRRTTAPEFEGEILISDENVLVGSKIFPITLRASGEYSYHSIRLTLDDGTRPWLRVDMLKALLK